MIYIDKNFLDEKSCKDIIDFYNQNSDKVYQYRDTYPLTLSAISSVTDKIYSPQMGRRQDGEEQLGITQLPYLEWDKWISELSKRRVGIHMMRTHAAGTFAMNCSYLGIPCIGYDGLDTQRTLHANLTVADGDLESARKLVDRLWNDLDFYEENRILTTELYNKHYSEEEWKRKLYNEFK